MIAAGIMPGKLLNTGKSIKVKISKYIKVVYLLLIQEVKNGKEVMKWIKQYL
jgi:hypothetical protein